MGRVLLPSPGRGVLGFPGTTAATGGSGGVRETAKRGDGAVGLVSRDTVRVPIPGEPGQWVEVRGLLYSERREAQRAQLAELAENMRVLADVADVVRQSRGDETAGDRADDPLAGYHWPTVLAAGLVAWSYGDGAPEPERLEEATARFVVRAILERSGVAFPDGEHAEKNSSGPGTGH